MGFFTATLALSQLLFEAAALIFGIVQFAEAVSNLHLAGKDFPAFGPLGLIGLLLGKRRDCRGEFVDDGRLHQVVFRSTFEQGSDGLARGFLGVERDVGVRGIEPPDKVPYSLARSEI